MKDAHSDTGLPKVRLAVELRDALTANPDELRNGRVDGVDEGEPEKRVV